MLILTFHSLYNGRAEQGIFDQKKKVVPKSEIPKVLFSLFETKNIFLISQPKHMLWVLNETVLLSTQIIC